MSWKTWNGPKIKGLTRQAVGKANYATLEAIGSSADQQVPHDEGHLQRSKFIKVEGLDGMISYGGGKGTGFPKVPYARRWHENSANFQKGRKSRYLADSYNQVGPRAYKNALVQALRQAW